MFWHSSRCSQAFLTSMSFKRERVPIVRWSFAGFWKMLSSTPWSYTSGEKIIVNTGTHYRYNILVSKHITTDPNFYHSYLHHLLMYLWTLLQNIIFKSEESCLNFGVIQRKWQEVCKRLLSPKTVNEDLDSCDCRWNCSFVGTCNNCQKKKEGQNKLFAWKSVITSVLLSLTNLPFHSLFWDVDRCLCVKF